MLLRNLYFFYFDQDPSHSIYPFNCSILTYHSWDNVIVIWDLHQYVIDSLLSGMDVCAVNLNMIDSTSEKNRTVATSVSNRSKRSSEDTDKERFSYHEDYHREDLHGAVATGTRLIYLLSNVPTSPSTLFTSLPATNVQDTKGGFHIRSQDQWNSLVGERFTTVLPSR